MSAYTKLPEELTARLKVQLGSQGLRSFLACFDREAIPGLRLNTLKGTVNDIADRLPFPLEPISWAPAGFIYPAEERPGKLALYKAGLYYLQEPSAMAPAAALDVKPGERVLDLCASPGGKTTQLASAMEAEGILVANDISPKRIKPLIWNLEHWGASNCAIMNEDPERLSAAFAGFFDKILVDAPCSGEGMLRKDQKALGSWRQYNAQSCREIQDRLLDQAANMLAAGGRMLYSTCTFNPMENEEAVAAFLERRPEMKLVPLPSHEGWQHGEIVKESRQLWPHLVKGEGQFLAMAEKPLAGSSGGRKDEALPSCTNDKAKQLIHGESMDMTGTLAPFITFMEENFTYPLKGPFAAYNNHIYQIPAGLPDLGGLRVSRPGWYLGAIKNHRFYPSQPLAMGLEAKQMKRTLELGPDEERTDRYLRGETLMTAGEKGWTLVTLAGYPLGFGKQEENYFKNDYASGWRVT